MSKYQINHNLLLCLLLVIAFANLIGGCDMDQTQNGCRIDNGACSCSFGCKSEYRYSNIIECQNALKGTTSDICSRKPCLNGGTCTQISQAPGYKCRCEGTGYFGTRCQRQCPSPHQPANYFPYECVVI